MLLYFLGLWASPVTSEGTPTKLLNQKGLFWQSLYFSQSTDDLLLSLEEVKISRTRMCHSGESKTDRLVSDDTLPGALINQVSAEQIHETALANLSSSIDSFRNFLSLPNDAHIPQDLEPNLVYLENAFRRLGFATERIPTDGIDLLYADRIHTPGAKTVLVYLQVDGQPVDASKWNQSDPFIPVLKAPDRDDWKSIPWIKLRERIDLDWRIFCRSASDAKGPISAFLTALEIAKEKGWETNYNLKIIMDCEEELGSPHLPAAVEANRTKLAADMLIIFDGPRHITNQPTLTFGARGITTMRLTTYGPRVPQHSGHYGNYAPNPAFRLAQLLASMKDESGRVTIPGFYDGITIDEDTRRILAEVPDDEKAIQKSIGIAHPEGVASTYQEAIQYPSLNIRGMSAAWVGTKVRTIIPSAAVVNLDIRTVKESNPRRLIELIRHHIEGQGFYICNQEPDEEERMTHPKILSMSHQISYGAFRTPFDSEVGTWLDRSLTRVFGTPPVKIRTSGGSIPIAPFVQTLGIPAVTVPCVNRDNNQHSPNENIRLGNYLDAIKTYLGILTEALL